MIEERYPLPTRPLPPIPSESVRRAVPKMGIVSIKYNQQKTQIMNQQTSPTCRKLIGNTISLHQTKDSSPNNSYYENNSDSIGLINPNRNGPQGDCNLDVYEENSVISLSPVTNVNHRLASHCTLPQGKDRIVNNNNISINNGGLKFDKLLKFNVTPTTILKSKIFNRMLRDKSLPCNMNGEMKKLSSKSKSLSRIFELKQVNKANARDVCKERDTSCSRSWTIKMRNDGSRYLLRKKLKENNKKLSSIVNSDSEIFPKPFNTTCGMWNEELSYSDDEDKTMRKRPTKTYARKIRHSIGNHLSKHHHYKVSEDRRSSQVVTMLVV